MKSGDEPRAGERATDRRVRRERSLASLTVVLELIAIERVLVRLRGSRRGVRASGPEQILEKAESEASAACSGSHGVSLAPRERDLETQN